jgi:hypothetical protein
MLGARTWCLVGGTSGSASEPTLYTASIQLMHSSDQLPRRPLVHTTDAWSRTLLGTVRGVTSSGAWPVLGTATQIKRPSAFDPGGVGYSRRLSHERYEQGEAPCRRCMHSQLSLPLQDAPMSSWIGERRCVIMTYPAQADRERDAGFDGSYRYRSFVTCCTVSPRGTVCAR